MAKGFSFVLVTVVMVMMTVFGLLSMVSARADLRLSQKAAETQQIYYELDAQGERLKASCGAAAATAQSDADAFMANKSYLAAQPDDFYSCLQPLVSAVRAQSGGSQQSLLARGVYFYFLEKELHQVTGSYNLSFKVDQTALSDALNGKGSVDAPVVYVYSTIKSTANSNHSLAITLTCDYGGGSGTPAFKATQWQSSVSGLDISGSQKIHVWQGK